MMSGYDDIRYAIQNSRIILADYGFQKEVRKTHGNTLIEKVADELQQEIQAPRGLIIAKLLSALSIGLQHLVDVQTPRGEVVPISCYFITLAKSGERKTAVESAAYKPIYEFQKELDEQSEKRQRDYSLELEIFEEKKRFLKKKIKRLLGKEECTKDAEAQLKALHEEKPQPPSDMQIIHTDSSAEAFVDRMSKGCKYAAIASGEGGVVLKSSAIKSPAVLCLYSGETVKITRKTSESSVVVNGRLTVSIDVQPGVFEEYFSKYGEVMEASGFFARTFMARPESTIGRRYKAKEESVNRSTNYSDYYEKLDAYVRMLPGILSGEKARIVVQLDEDAEEKMVMINNAIEHEMNPGGIFEGHDGYGSKLGEKILRLACLLSVFEQGPQEKINSAVIDHSLHLAMYFVKQHREIFNQASQEERDEVLLQEWIDKKRSMGIRYIKKNTVRRVVVPESLRNSKRLNAAIDRLVQKQSVVQYFSGNTVCLDFFPWLTFDYVAAMSVGGSFSGRRY